MFCIKTRSLDKHLLLPVNKDVGGSSFSHTPVLLVQPYPKAIEESQRNVTSDLLTLKLDSTFGSTFMRFTLWRNDGL